MVVAKKSELQKFAFLSYTYWGFPSLRFEIPQQQKVHDILADKPYLNTIHITIYLQNINQIFPGVKES